MKNSLRVSTMEAEKRKSFEDLFEEEEDVGLACPPFDEEDFMAAEGSYSDLSEEVFFCRIENDHKKGLAVLFHHASVAAAICKDVPWDAATSPSNYIRRYEKN
ncbi:hypothetical protein POTOM_000256 [Populus tomentosa]|uniref:Uncharacterized protein n=1 Tax=Populus tomentosa TaxID=118781 RepID=A0A8X8AMM3_POPTO|nr:hypothetical protein POTOM_000256 [Populus tomentosa]